MHVPPSSPAGSPARKGRKYDETGGPRNKACVYGSIMLVAGGFGERTTLGALRGKYHTPVVARST